MKQDVLKITSVSEADLSGTRKMLQELVETLLYAESASVPANHMETSPCMSPKGAKVHTEIFSSVFSTYFHPTIAEQQRITSCVSSACGLTEAMLGHIVLLKNHVRIFAFM